MCRRKLSVPEADGRLPTALPFPVCCFSADVTYFAHSLQVAGKRYDSHTADSALARPGFADNRVFF